MKSPFSSRSTPAHSPSTPSYEMLPTRNSSPPGSPPSNSIPRKPSRTPSRTPFPYRTVLALTSLPLALLPIILLASLAEKASTSYLAGRDCYPNGLWSRSPDATWRIMDSSYFFTPNLSFGNLSFTQVKVIDIAWDLVIGRGGQLVLAWVDYVVFNEWIVFHMEAFETSYKLATSVALQTTTMGTLGVLGKEVLAFGERTWGRFWRWVALVGMLLATGYVLAFPTLMAAMTGYTSTYEAYVMDEGGRMMPWWDVRHVQYVVRDAVRVPGYAGELVAVDDDKELIAAIANCEYPPLPFQVHVYSRLANRNV